MAVIVNTLNPRGAASDEEALQSSKVMACAPLIYFFYSYGVRHPSSGSFDVADELYDYAVTNITGPVSTQQTLNNLLRTWGVQVTSAPVTASALRGAGRLEATLAAAARKAMNASADVHIDVISTRRNSTEIQHASFDSGAHGAVETLTDGAATGYLRVTSAAAYFSGNAAGLSNFFGMSKAAVARIGSHLPVGETASSSGTTQIDTFSRWGTPPAVTAPGRTIPFTTATAGT